jgi:hypothetical protein
MNTLCRERYEIPLVHRQGPLFLDVMCHASKVLLVNVIYQDTTQAVYYPPADDEISCSQAERACRMALGHFRSRSFDLYLQERRSILRRCVLILDANGPLYDGVLLRHQDDDQRERATSGANLTAS